MKQVPNLRPHVLAAKRALAEGRERIAKRHGQGAPGIQIAGAMSDLIDNVVVDLYNAAMQELPADLRDLLRRYTALVATGGCGRRDPAPYSDVDVMLLAASHVEADARPLAERLFRDLSDLGVDSGFSFRTPQNACTKSLTDATICTALIESRYLTGSVKLFIRFVRRFTKTVQRGRRKVLAAIEEARGAEQAKFGETVYLLQPHVKRSYGGLREFHLLRWIGFVGYGTPEIDDLRLRGAISRGEARQVRQATEFLLRLRNEMHFHAASRHDLLDWDEQVRLAELYGYPGDEAILPVEQFMREYFRQTQQLARIASRFAEGAVGDGWIVRAANVLFSRRMEGDYRVGPRQIWATKRGLAKLRSSLTEVVHLADLANHADKQISYDTTEAIRPYMRRLPDEVPPEAARRFRQLLDRPIRLGPTLRWLYDLGVLEIFVPALWHARYLLQFNVYHKYTVDEHCLRAVEAATRLAENEGLLGRVYRSTKRKYLLHLALLLHDLGKGYSEDHSEVGTRIAQGIAARLDLAKDDAEVLRFLVHRHLLMSNVAFLRNIDDEKVVVQFAVECGSPSVLRLLYTMTAADMMAVGPEVWTDWKEQVLAALYQSANAHLAGDDQDAATDAKIEPLRAEVRRLVDEARDREWFDKQIRALPASCFRPPAEVTPAQLAAELRELFKLKHDEVLSQARYLPEASTVEYTVGTYEEIVPGVFHRLCGALAGERLEVLQAEIHTLADGLVLDRFYVNDLDFSDQPSEDRVAAVQRALIRSLRDPTDQPPKFGRRWHAALQLEARNNPLRDPPRVRTDIHTSDDFTIVEVFVADQPGLLYTVARQIFELGLSVSVAKIGTYRDQVVDVFYVTDAESGGKVDDPARLDHVRARLTETLEKLDAES